MHHRLTIRSSPVLLASAFMFAIAFQVNCAQAGCGDYLHVRGQKVEMPGHGEVENSEDAAEAEIRTSQNHLAPVDEVRPPVDSPCKNGNCENDRLPIRPVAPSPSTSVDLDDFAMAGDSQHAHDQRHDQPFLSTIHAPRNTPESVDRPPE